MYSGTNVTTRHMKMFAVKIFNKLRDITLKDIKSDRVKVYSDSCERLRSLNEISYDGLYESLVAKPDPGNIDDLECFYCKDYIACDSVELLRHIQGSHPLNAASSSNAATPGDASSPSDAVSSIDASDAVSGGGKTTKGVYSFSTSSGWLHNYCRRYDIHKIQGCGEKGSSDQQEADKFVLEFRTKCVERGISPRKKIKILINIDETGLF